MKKIMSNKFMRIVANVVVFIVVWALIDWIITLFTKQTFVFSPLSNLVYPAVAGVVSGLLDPLGKKG